MNNRDAILDPAQEQTIKAYLQAYSAQPSSYKTVLADGEEIGFTSGMVVGAVIGGFVGGPELAVYGGLLFGAAGSYVGKTFAGAIKGAYDGAVKGGFVGGLLGFNDGIGVAMRDYTLPWKTPTNEPDTTDIIANFVTPPEYEPYVNAGLSVGAYVGSVLDLLTPRCPISFSARFAQAESEFAGGLYGAYDGFVKEGIGGVYDGMVYGRAIGRFNYLSQFNKNETKQNRVVEGERCLTPANEIFMNAFISFVPVLKYIDACLEAIKKDILAYQRKAYGYFGLYGVSQHQDKNVSCDNEIELVVVNKK